MFNKTTQGAVIGQQLIRSTRLLLLHLTSLQCVVQHGIWRHLSVHVTVYSGRTVGKFFLDFLSVRLVSFGSTWIFFQVARPE